MNSNVLLSIIIPVYGVENYISKLMGSLFPQLNSSVECIFIDDGCLDQSVQIIQDRLKHFDLKQSIKIIHQKNQGLSAARNTGIAHAIGAYIAFLDSDDYVLEHYISAILSAIKQQDFDIMHFNAIKNNHLDEIHPLQLVDQTAYIKVSDTYLDQLFQKNHWYAWLRVINRKYIHELTFPRGYLLEDSLAIPQLYKKIDTVYEIAEPLVFYQYREGSIMNSGKTTKLLNSYEKGIENFRSLRDDPHYRVMYEKFIIYSLKDRLIGSYQAYCNFAEQYRADLIYISNFLDIDKIHWKTKWMIKYPKTFFFYKAYTRFFNLRNRK